MIGTVRSLPTTVSGSRPPDRPTKRAPICSSGPVTRAIGRLFSEASPVNTQVIGCDATRPISRRAAVPLLPMSSTCAGSARPPRPTPRTRHTPSSPRSARAPSRRMAAAVFSTSSPSSRPWMTVSPTATAPSISDRCEIDLSPGTRMVPASAPVTDERSGFACSMGGLPRQECDQGGVPSTAEPAMRAMRKPAVNPRPPHPRAGCPPLPQDLGRSRRSPGCRRSAPSP